ncbi:Putative V-type ATPase, D subunit [Candidatus Sulfobium mesophilum]|uniref:V-type ATPase, D subunit n=1 Tax=Candidatus Sulfobium mesophilum TaxID=2016548 RepID=A0A2U3QFQ2_9BACT|nr:Putative V-type ATPase, D subunit [Candidatus Sulfobium mesophilum]
MIHPTRTNLLMLREKAVSVANSIRILKARKQALTREFLETTRPFLRSREEIRARYGKALTGLAVSLGHEGKECIESIIAAASRDFRIDIAEKSIWGLRYKEVAAHVTPVRDPAERGYDYFSTTPHLEECIREFEKILEALIGMAAFEGKLKRLGDEILKTSRRVRVLEERVLPGLNYQLRAIAQHIGERERESYCRLKRFRDKKSRENKTALKTMR